MRRWWWGGLLWGLLAACTQQEHDDTADAAVREFVEVLQGFRGQEEDAKALYQLLSPRAQRNLQERADRYAAASGKPITPWAMLAPAHTLFRFTPRSYEAQVAGRYAMVEVKGAAPEQRMQLPCVRVEEHWRVDLVLPELPPMRRRQMGP